MSVQCDVYVYVVVLSWRASSDAGTNVGHWVWVGNNNHGGHAAGGRPDADRIADSY